MAKVKKEFYQKPTIKVVEFDLNKAICNNVATMSTCLDKRNSRNCTQL